MPIETIEFRNLYNEAYSADVLVPEGSPRALVILAHGFKSFKDWGFWPPIAETCAARGYVAVRFDFSRNGIGDDKSTFEHLDRFEQNTFGLEMDDLHRVVEYARQRFDLPVYLWGHSRGGGLSILYAGSNRTVSGIITWSAVSTFDRWNAALREMFAAKGYIEVSNKRTGQIMRVGRALIEEFDAERHRFDILAHASRLQVPHLVVHGEKDSTSDIQEGRAIAAASPQSELLAVPGAEHVLGGRHPWEEPPSQTFSFVLTESLKRLDRWTEAQGTP